MSGGHQWLMLALLTVSVSATAQLELEGKLNLSVPVRANLTLATCNLTLTDRSGTPLGSVEFGQMDAGVVSGPISQTEFALTPAAGSDGHCFSNTPDFTATADFDAMGNIRNSGSAGNVAVRLWGITSGGLEVFSATNPTRAMEMQSAGRLWLMAELNPINPALPITAGHVEATASFDVVYK